MFSGSRVLACLIVFAATHIAPAQQSPTFELRPVGFPERSGNGSRLKRPDLARALQTWQRKLQLVDWNVAIQVVDDRALGGRAVGDIHWDMRSKRAFIRVLRQEDYDLPVEMAHLDQQATILHELVHLLHAANRDQRGTDEASVVQQTNALLRANHQWNILAVQEQ
jgi:hypothetical protein